MPPKKNKAATGETAEGDKGMFRWTSELDLKLLTCIVTPRTVSKKEHELIATKLGVPTAGGVRNRIDKLKRDLRTAMEELGDVPGDGTATATAKDSGKGKDKPKTAAKKRTAKQMLSEPTIGQDDDDASEPAPETKKQKPRAKKVKKEEAEHMEPEGLLADVPSE